MNPHIHDVNESRHQAFLSEGRKDPFTQEKIKAGDRIVFCAGCKSAFLHSSWEAMRGRHCEQTETLTEFPHTLRLGDVTKLQTEIQVLNDQITNQQRKIGSLTQDNEETNVKIKFLATLCYLFPVIIAGIGYFAYDQYQRIQSLQSLNTDKRSQIVSLEQQRDRIEAKIAALSGKISLDNCQNDNNIKQPTPLEQKIAVFEKKLDCLLTQRDNFQNQRNSYKNQRDFYQNALNAYPYSIPPGSEVNYRGYLSTSNSQSNPIFYRLYVPSSSRFDIYLKDMEADGDFEIIDSQGNTVNNSLRTSSGSSDELRNFYLSSGYYNIKIWNYSTERSTYFTLRVYRIEVRP